MKRQDGFLLLEAIVALVLIATVGMALFEWINSNLVSLAHVEDANARAQAAINVIEYMNTVNPMLREEGKANLGDYRFFWRARPVTNIYNGANYPQGESLYQLALYDNTVHVLRHSGAPWFSLTLKQVGYKRVRELKLPF